MKLPIFKDRDLAKKLRAKGRKTKSHSSRRAARLAKNNS